MPPSVTADDEGKPVLDGRGERVGIVAEVDAGTAYVDPDRDIDADLKSKLGWGPSERTTYPLRADAIAAVTADAVELRDAYLQD